MINTNTFALELFQVLFFWHEEVLSVFKFKILESQIVCNKN